MNKIKESHKKGFGKMMSEKIFQYRLNDSLERFKNNIAIEYGSRVLTYAQLDTRSNTIANWIINKGIKRQTFIGILMNDRMELISTAVGILKAGCVIVPLYSAYPGERLETMIHSTNLKYIFIDQDNAHWFEINENREFLLVNDFFSDREPLTSVEPPDVLCKPGDRLYIHFTSGTTGTPKAVLGQNKSLLHFIQWEIETFRIQSNCRAAQFTIPGFDPFLRDVFVPLFSGGVVCIPEKEEIIMNPGELVSWVDEQRISLIHCVSGLFRLLSADSLTPDHFKALTCILLAGEKIAPSDLVHWYDVFDERIQLVNCYGPTETTQSKVYYLIGKSDINRERIPIGKPLKGCRIIILDKEMNICAPLDAGEIYIRTPFRSLGYYNDPGLTKEKFIQNPFNNDPDDILYRSGDLGRFLLDGNIDILGRVDRQIKIRGYRVELEEIESVLTGHSSVKETVVIKIERPGGSPNNEMLCAYITAPGENRPGAETFVENLKGYVSEKLPDYMVPAVIKEIDQIPRGATGKVDFDALPHPFQSSERAYIAPRDDIERRLAKLWSEILVKKEISMNERFTELGGNSLNVMTLIAKIHREFDIRISLGALFKIPTIEMQAAFIKGTVKEEYVPIEAAEEKEFYQLSFNQKRLWIMNSLEPESPSYNILRRVELKHKVDTEAIKKGLGKLMERHESLKTSFRLVEDKLVQLVEKEADISFGLIDISSLEPGEKEIRRAQFFDEARTTVFDLAKAPLFRTLLLKRGEETYDLIFNMHHIISDGMSMEILKKEFFLLYEEYKNGNGAQPEPVKLQYKDFAEWQNKQLENPGLKDKSLQFWQKKMRQRLPELKLPRDSTEPVNLKSRESALCGFIVSDTIKEQLKQMARDLDASLFMILFSGFNMIISWISGQKDIVCGFHSAGREHVNLQNTVGFFVNTLILKNHVDYEENFKDFLAKVGKDTSEAIQHQGYPLELVLDDLNMEFPDIPVMFNMLSMQGTTEDIHMIPGELYYIDKVQDVKFDMAAYVIEYKNGIKIECQYKKRVYKRQRLEYVMEQYLRLLESIACDPGKKIREYFTKKKTRKVTM